MKPIVKIAVLATVITTLATSCRDEERTTLLAEMEATITEMRSTDSALNGMNNFIIQRKDSLEAAAAADPQQKPFIDSILQADKQDYEEIQQMNLNHLKQTQTADSLSNEVRNGKIETEQAKAKWEMLKAEHIKAKEFADKNTLALLLILLTEKNKTGVDDSSKQKEK